MSMSAEVDQDARKLCEVALRGDGGQAHAVADGHWPIIEAGRSGLRGREGLAACRAWGQRVPD